MKRILCVMIFVLLLCQSQSAFCAVDENVKNIQSNSIRKPLINRAQYCDELVGTTLINKYKKPIVSMPNFQDEFVSQTLKNTYKKPNENRAIIKDKIADDTLKSNYAKPYVNLNYDYESIKYSLFKVKINKQISSRNAREGQKVLFKTIEPVKINDRITFAAGTEVCANVEFVSLNEMRGEPATLIIDNFEVKNYPQYKLSGQIYKEGAKRSYWVNPMSIMLMPFWGTGLFLHLVRGGHAKIKPNKVYKLYLWNNDK